MRDRTYIDRLNCLSRAPGWSGDRKFCKRSYVCIGCFSFSNLKNAVEPSVNLSLVRHVAKPPTNFYVGQKQNA